MKVKRILKIIFAVFAALLFITGGFILLYTIPRNVELDAINDAQAITVGKYSLYFDEENGCFSVAKSGTTIFENAVSAYKINERIIKSSDYTNFELSAEDIEDGKKVTVRMRADGLDDFIQTFNLYNEKDYFTVQSSVYANGEEIKTNYIAPLLIEHCKLQNSTFKWKNSLEVPFDNDGWAEFEVKKIFQKSVSYEVGALFTADDGSGLIMGSLEHNKWKSAVRFNGGFGKIQKAELFCGATDPRTGDEPHGTVSGKEVASPLMFIGVYDNWKNGLNDFGSANTDIQPKRHSVSNGVPIGWNSWGSVQTDLSYDLAVQTSDYIKDNFQQIWQADGADVYVNLDSFWDNMSDEELKAFVNHCHANNQKAGIYWAPFVSWYDEDSMKTNYVQGSDSSVTYNDVRLKKSDGSYYDNEIDGCYPLDVTHPAVKQQAAVFINRFKAAGFDYIKLDFLVHGSFEGNFYNREITTGIEAYNYGMKYITELIGDDIFINLAMSPTFPYQYANGRRFACDSYSHINETEYTMNALTYGFWEQQLYDYTDPDHIVVWGKDADTTSQEARSRVTSGVISGTSFLAGDNFISPNGNVNDANERFITMLGNKKIINTAKIGKAFIPVITNVNNKAANVFKLEANGKLYIAVINYNKRRAETFQIDLNGKKYTATELWSGKESTVSGTLNIKLKGSDSAVYELTSAE